jgi:hypothetical protein
MEEQKEITHQCSGQREDYSATQWGKPVRQRRCKICVGNPPTVPGSPYCEVGNCTRNRQTHHPRCCPTHAAQEECAENCTENSHTGKCKQLRLMKTIKGALNKAIGRVTKDMPLTQTSTTRTNSLLTCRHYHTKCKQKPHKSRRQKGTAGSPLRRRNIQPNNTANDIAPLYTPSCQCPAKICRRQAETLPALAGHQYCPFCGPTPCSCACICACDGGDYCSGDDYDDGH